MKDGEAGTVMASRLDRVELGTDADGDPLSSCVIIPTEVVPRKVSKTQALAFDLLKRLIKN